MVGGFQRESGDDGASPLSVDIAGAGREEEEDMDVGRTPGIVGGGVW